MSSDSLAFIYILKDPDTGEPRYVGKAKNPKVRFSEHVCPYFLRRNTHKNNWIKALLGVGTLPVLEVVAEVPKNEWSFWECRYIEFFKEVGARLTNATRGGEGFTGRHSQATREKIGNANRGQKRSLETCEKIRLIKIGHSVSSATREKLRAANLGKFPSAETTAKRRVALLARWKRVKEAGARHL